MLSSNTNNHVSAWLLACNGSSHGSLLGGCWPAMCAAIVMGGCWFALEATMMVCWVAAVSNSDSCDAGWLLVNKANSGGGELLLASNGISSGYSNGG